MSIASCLTERLASACFVPCAKRKEACQAIAAGRRFRQLLSAGHFAVEDEHLPDLGGGR